ncbi:MAG TPA: metal ABC transporter substrate-binding protein [Candidatus Baltobacteraceae bacterium]|nr:metal ABC transporter substrate-binding protein [Candidatus Baltobacteraceae bacterium]
MSRIVALALALIVVGCSSSAPRQGRGPSIPQNDTHAINVVTTFSTLNSFVEGVGGDRVRVQNLVPVGASPENYQPSPQDIATLSGAQLVVENGAGIEAWLQHTIASAGNANMQVLVLSDGLPRIAHNPHLWMDPVLARAYVGKIRDALVRLDPAHKSDYERNAKAYDAQLVSLQNWIAAQIATIPPKQRAMIVFHNAWDYYNRRFGIVTVGVIELSPGQDPNPAYIGQLVDLARRHNVRAVFSEPEYSPKLAQTLAKSAGIRIVSNLYDDSIGSDPRVHDYISMLRYDTGVIVQALK